jgi:hypothetical protein
MKIIVHTQHTFNSLDLSFGVLFGNHAFSQCIKHIGLSLRDFLALQRQSEIVNVC